MAHRVLRHFSKPTSSSPTGWPAQPADARSMERKFLAHCVAVGRQYVLQKRLRNPECVGRELLATRSLLAPIAVCCNPAPMIYPEAAPIREETAAAVSAVSAIGELDYQLHHGAQGQG